MSIYLKIISLICVTLLLVGCDDKHETKNVPTYQVLTVKNTNLNDNIEQTSIIKPITQALISSPVAGYLNHQYIPYGSSVKSGEKLFSVMDEDSYIKLFAALSDYQSAKWDNFTAQKKYEDYKLQFQAGLIANTEVSLKEIDFKRTQIKLLQSEFELNKVAEKANLDTKELKNLNLEQIKKFFIEKEQSRDLTISSTHAGTLIPIPLDPEKGYTSVAKPGSKVEAGQAIAAISNLNVGELQIDLDEQQIGTIKVGMPVDIVNISNQNKTLTGNISAIKLFEYIGQADAPTRYPIIIRVDSKSIIQPGTRCKAIIQMKSRDSIEIPINAVHDPYHQPYVQMADGSKRPIKLGKTSIDKVEITQGLKPQEKILVPTKSTPKTS